MSLVIKAIANAFRDLIRFKIAWIIIWPVLVATSFWLLVGYMFGDSFSQFTHQALGEWLKNVEPDWIATSIQSVLHVVLLVLLIIVTTLLITAIFVMPALINLVAKRSYPELKRMHGGDVIGSVVNALLASGIFILIWIVTLPLWTVGAGLLVPFVAVAFMNQQLFRYDALSEHANKQEIKTICAENRYSLWSLGLLTGFIQFVPILNFVAPIFTALAFIHFGLEHLKRLRSENRQSSMAE